MLTIQRLQEYGINTKEGLARCMNMEKFYFRMLGMGLKNDSFARKIFGGRQLRRSV